MNKLNIITFHDYYSDWYFRVKHPETGKRNYLEKQSYLQNNTAKKIIKTHIEQVTYNLVEAFDHEFNAYQIFPNIFMTTKLFQASHDNVNIIIEIDWVWDLRNE